jgi:hypothetical protein
MNYDRTVKTKGKFPTVSDGRFPDYLRRLCDIRQMDFEATFDQILTLLSHEPHKVYTTFYYRKRKEKANF